MLGITGSSVNPLKLTELAKALCSCEVGCVCVCVEVGGGAGGVHRFSQTLIDDPVVSNLLHKVKLGGYRHNSFHGSCSNNKDTWGVNLLPEHQRDTAPRRFIARQAAA